MTPQTANLNLVNALQAQPGGKKQPDPGTSADTPFSKVLSNEMEQKKPVNEPKQASRPETRQAGKSGSGTAASDAPATQDAASTETASPSTAETAASEPQAAPAADSSTLQPDAALPGMEITPALPDALLALAAAPNMPVPAVQAAPLPGGGVSATADALAAGATVLPSLNTPAAPALTPAQITDAAAAAAVEAAAQQPVKADFQAAMTATPAHASAAAAVLPGQIAAALSPDALKLDEARPEGFGNLLTTATQLAQPGTISAPASTAGNALAPSVGSAAWSQALGEKIVWMAAGAQQTASLTLNPPNLGPLQVVINVNNDQATASFFAAQPEVRQALEAALPRLREMMNESGIQLGQATVSAEQQQQQFNEAANREARRTAMSYPGASSSGDTTIQSLPTQIRQSGRGLVDTFA
ncbi:flagellar hook-length control protein FliK [Thiobacillus sp.]|uniref:flagellar hook-length control protein FliK n=1 Tax=Thiobacillus sp. TaxID=924 RepID=UPI0025DCFBFB|nr:flagellar hook-length control protein FliK [Thiobacillus sp.]MBT9540499.1 flagellar hook-length control protein FliK [Thiobacillus sp.]